MGAAESTPREQSATGRRTRVTSTMPAGSTATHHDLQEKFDAFSIADDRGITSHKQGTGPDISVSKSESYIKTVLSDPKNRLALCALASDNPAKVLEKPSAIVKDTQTFNLAIPTEGSPITNQRQSGRCWIFASTNVFRVAIMKKYKLDKFELSQNHLFFWDKVEKANFFLESMLETADQPLDGRLVSQLMAAPVNDGGQFDMIVNLVQKYGLVPQSLYPDTWNAMNSSTMDKLITTKLRQDGLRLRALKKKTSASSPTAAASIAAAKEHMLQDMIRILTLTLGPPPSATEKFIWEFYDKKHLLKTLELSPLDFAAGLNDTHGLRACGGTDVHNLFSLVNDPRNEYNRLLTVDHLGNVWGGRPITYVNVHKDVLKSACVEMLRRGFPVFFGSDVGKYSDSAKGIMDTELVDYELGFNVRLGMTKAERLMTGESAMTHAMVLTAVHLSPEGGKPVRWRVENSWSETAGTDGYFVMSDRWMDEFCYQAVVDPSVVSAEVNDVLKQKAKVLPAWDPMGALA